MLPYKTEPLEHQRKELEAHWDAPYRGILWEQGTGKTWLAINTAARLYHTRRIDAAIVLAPSGVHQNWYDELEAHCPIAHRCFVWSTTKAKQKQFLSAFNHFTVRTDQGGFLPVLSISYDSMMTDAGATAIKAVLNGRHILLIADESQRIKTPGAKRTKRALAIAKHAAYRLILTGTPVTDSPFEAYTQYRFLDSEFWVPHGMASYQSFKTMFGVFDTGYNGSRQFRQVVDYRNLELLKRIIAPVSSRVTKAEVLDLPPKVYSKVYFELTPEQRTLCNQLRDELVAELEGGEMTAPLAITRLVRFQQIASGFAVDDEGNVRPLKNNPRLKALESLLEDRQGKVIIYARFRYDIDAICSLLGDQAVRYDGAVGEDDRKTAVDRFQNDPDILYFVGNPAACSTGLTLHAASSVVYYSNSFNLEQRLQSEDRAHRIGQRKSVTYIDLVGERSIDEKIVPALRKKRNVAAIVTGDNITEWI